MYQSIPSLIIPPGKTLGQFFDGRIPHPLGEKKVQNPAYKNELKSHPWGIFLNYSF